MGLFFSDETLRDGEQQVGVNFSVEEKYLIAKKLVEAGVDQIVIMPIISKREEQLAKKLLKSKFSNNIYAVTMLDKKFIDHSIRLGFKNIILFASLSERLLKLKKIKKNKNMADAIGCCKYARSKGLNVIFAGEDSTRTEKKYLLKFIKSIEKYIFGFIICDTVGILTPSKTKKLVLEIKDKIDCKLGVHFHNDRGLADKNTLAAIESGAVIVSGTTGGIGERAGNADLCNIALNCKVGDIDLEKLTAIKSLVYKLGGSKPAKPLSRRAFWHESGIHVNALLKDPLSYNASLPEKNGRNNKFFFGKFSGISNYRYLFKDKYSEKQLIKMRDFFKELSYKNKKSYSAGEIRRILLEKGFDRMH